jgi:hypothetical protein
MAIALVLCEDCPALAPMATAKLFWSVDPARDPMEITVLRREIVLVARVFTEIELPVTLLTTLVLAFTVLTLRMFVQSI